MPIHKWLVRILCLVFFLCFHGPQWSSAQITEPVVVDTALQDNAEIQDETLYESDVPEDEEGYDPSLYSLPPVKPVAMRELDGSKWDDASSGLDYSKDVPAEPKQTTQPNRSFNPDWNASTAGLGKIMQILAIVLAIAAIVYGIYRTMQAPRNRRIGQAQDGTIITAENVDAYIHETDLERFLREALEAGSYALAIRLYYLQTIKLLSEKESIKWSREKTNRDYLREMRDHRLGREFREATRTFERIWYGNEPLNAEGFARLEPGFKGLLAQI